MDAKSKPISLNPEEQSSHEAYEKIAGQISAAGVEYSELRAKRSRTPEEEVHLAELKEKLTVANQEMGRFFKTLYVEFGKNAQANQIAENVREQAGGMQSIVRELGPGTVALYTLVGVHDASAGISHRGGRSAAEGRGVSGSAQESVE
jgi:hypothetical protein